VRQLLQQSGQRGRIPGGDQTCWSADGFGQEARASGMDQKNQEYMGLLLAMPERIQKEGTVHKNGAFREASHA